MRRTWNKEKIIAAIKQRLAAGVKPERRTAKWSRSKVLMAIAQGREDSTIKAIARDYFGSWSTARAAAGLELDGTEPLINHIQEVRKRKGLSQAEVGQRIGRSHRAIGLLEAGVPKDPGVSVALKLAQALECRVEDLFELREHTQQHQG
jgi:DNA-binding XRE family transcriptional regulator